MKNNSIIRKHYRPWPIIFLSSLYFLEPLIKTCILMLAFKMPLWTFIQYIWKLGGVKFFEFFLLFPLAGYSIFIVKKWSLYLFLTCEAWIIWINYDYVLNIYKSQNIVFVLILCLYFFINIIVVLIFLNPSIRMAYTDPRRRWWEALPRYGIQVEALIDGSVNARIENVSLTGLFIKTSKDLDVGKEYDVAFNYNKSEFKTRFKVIHSFYENKVKGHGCQFVETDNLFAQQMTELVNQLENSKVPRRPPRRNGPKDFFAWLLESIFFYKNNKH